MTTQAIRTMKKRIRSTVGALGVFLVIPVFAWAHDSSITISAPTAGQEFWVSSLPVDLTVPVSGTIIHSAPPTGASVADNWACVSVDAGTPVCNPAPTFGGRPPTSYDYSVNVTITSLGAHTLQASTRKSDGGHPGQSDPVTIYVYLTPVTCDEVDPPAYANQYMNTFNPPQAYAQFRGLVIRQIAYNHSQGMYGTCTYDYPAVEEDVCTALLEVGGPACPAE